MNQKIFVLLATNDQDSFCTTIFDTVVQKSLKAKNQVKTLQFRENDFNPELIYGYKKRQELEPQLALFVDNYIWCDKLIIIYPIWWGQFPSKLKGLIDRAILPGVLISKKQKPTYEIPKALYPGKQVLAICTIHAPAVFSYFMPNSKAFNYIFKLALKNKTKVKYIRVNNTLEKSKVAQKVSKFKI